jgi:hypothetical protein
MTQVTNYTVANGPPAKVRTDFNAVLAALRDCNAGSIAPQNPVAWMLWLDISIPSLPVLRIRNAANDTWQPLEEVIGMSAMGLTLAYAPNEVAVLAALGISALPNEINRIADLPTPPAGHFLAGDPSWNFAIGATDYSNPTYWSASETVNGVIFTQISSDINPATKGRRVIIDAVGTLTASTASFGYISTASLTNGVSDETWTVSAILNVTGPAGGGGGAAQVGSGVRVFQFQNGVGTSVFGTPVVNNANAVSTVTRTLGVTNNVRCGVQLTGSSGNPINARLVIEDLQFEKAAARSIGRYAHLSPAQAREALGVSSGRSSIISVANANTDFLNLIPAGVTSVKVDAWGVMSNSNNTTPRLQLGHGAGTFVTSGYTGGGTNQVGTFTSYPDGFGAINGWISTNVSQWEWELTLLDAATNRWASRHSQINTTGSTGAWGHGHVALPAALSSIRFSAASGNLFTAGSIRMTWRSQA